MINKMVNKMINHPSETTHKHIIIIISQAPPARGQRCLFPGRLLGAPRGDEGPCVGTKAQAPRRQCQRTVLRGNIKRQYQEAILKGNIKRQY